MTVGAAALILVLSVVGLVVTIRRRGLPRGLRIGVLALLALVAAASLAYLAAALILISGIS